MSLFIADITLHQAVAGDHLLLNQQLTPKFFQSEANQLPNVVSNKNAGNEDASLHIQYLRKGDLSLLDVINEVREAVSKTGKKFSFTIRKEKRPAYQKD
ncbi:MAG: hypothetical protein QM594_06420 [Niabella sp.]